MSQSIPAIYENGTLRLLESVELEEGQQVQVQIEPTDKWAMLREIFGDSIQLPNPQANPNPEVEDMAEELAEEFGKGQPVSEMIIEDRGEI